MVLNSAECRQSAGVNAPPSAEHHDNIGFPFSEFDRPIAPWEHDTGISLAGLTQTPQLNLRTCNS
jgi:hypothetical protein